MVGSLAVTHPAIRRVPAAAHRSAWRGLWIVLAALAAGRLALLAAVAALAPLFGVVMPAVPFVTKALVTGAMGIALQVALLSPAARFLAPVDRRR